jgi:hypothetical protein
MYQVFFDRGRKYHQEKQKQKKKENIYLINQEEYDSFLFEMLQEHQLPNGITLYTKFPKFVVKLIRSILPSAIHI